MDAEKFFLIEDSTISVFCTISIYVYKKWRAIIARPIQCRPKPARSVTVQYAAHARSYLVSSPFSQSPFYIPPKSQGEDTQHDSKIRSGQTHPVRNLNADAPCWYKWYSNNRHDQIGHIGTSNHFYTTSYISFLINMDLKPRFRTPRKQSMAIRVLRTRVHARRTTRFAVIIFIVIILRLENSLTPCDLF